MIKSKVSTVAAAVILALGTAGLANAFTLTAGDYKFTIDNYDSGNTGYLAATGNPCLNNSAACDAASLANSGFIGAPGAGTNPSADTLGIISVAAIQNITTGQTVFTKGGINGYITGLFGNLVDQTVVTTCGILGCDTVTLSKGGTFSLWSNTTDWNPLLGPTVQASPTPVDINAGIYDGITNGTAILYLNGHFAAGAVQPGCPTCTYKSHYDDVSFAGSGQGFLDLDPGGTAYNTFNTNSLLDVSGVKRDLFLDVTFNDVNKAASSIGWTVTSAGQVKGAVIPEPGSLALVALALLGVGAISRRNKI